MAGKGLICGWQGLIRGNCGWQKERILPVDHIYPQVTGVISFCIKSKTVLCCRCWQRKELVGTVRLVVEKEHNIKFQKPVVIIGTFIIFALFSKIYYKAFTLA